MAKGDLRIPEPVIEDIRKRFELRITKTIAEFDSASEDEDSMTGHLGANLTTHARKVYVPDVEISGNWTWSLRYRKFRGRGPGATENKIGADGILELIVGGSFRPRIKSMLFQSKMEGSSDTRGLVEQCADLSTWREAAAVFSYGRNQFRAFTLDAILASKGQTAKTSGADLAKFLSDTFIGCEIGDTELRYDSDQKMLSWRDWDRKLVVTRFLVKHRIRINVKPPSSEWSYLQGAYEISPDEIIKHRMAVEDRDMLGVNWDATPEEINRAQKSLTKVYHPDRWHGYADKVKVAMEARTKEFQGLNPKKN